MSIPARTSDRNSQTNESAILVWPGGFHCSPPGPSPPGRWELRSQSRAFGSHEKRHARSRQCCDSCPGPGARELQPACGRSERGNSRQRPGRPGSMSSSPAWRVFAASSFAHENGVAAPSRWYREGNRKAVQTPCLTETGVYVLRCSQTVGRFFLERVLALVYGSGYAALRRFSFFLRSNVKRLIFFLRLTIACWRPWYMSSGVTLPMASWSRS